MFYNQQRNKNSENIEKNVQSSYEKERITKIINHLNEIKEQLKEEQEMINQSWNLPICEETPVKCSLFKCLIVFWIESSIFK